MTKDEYILFKRLNKHLEFYYSLIEAKYIGLGVYIGKDTVEVIQVDKEEWQRWQKIKSIIDKFEVPT